MLKPPITTSVTGMKQAVLALENSTPEVLPFTFISGMSEICEQDQINEKIHALR
jgi:hypothetical protein